MSSNFSTFSSYEICPVLFHLLILTKFSYEIFLAKEKQMFTLFNYNSAQPLKNEDQCNHTQFCTFCFAAFLACSLSKDDYNLFKVTSHMYKYHLTYLC